MRHQIFLGTRLTLNRVLVSLYTVFPRSFLTSHAWVSSPQMKTIIPVFWGTVQTARESYSNMVLVLQTVTWNYYGKVRLGLFLDTSLFRPLVTSWLFDRGHMRKISTEKLVLVLRILRFCHSCPLSSLPQMCLKMSSELALLIFSERRRGSRDLWKLSEPWRTDTFLGLLTAVGRGEARNEPCLNGSLSLAWIWFFFAPRKCLQAAQDFFSGTANRRNNSF